MKTYTFHQDPGHGWLEVPRAELQALGIAHRISGYSYESRDGATVYLEEDCDLSTFAHSSGWGADGFDWRALVKDENYGCDCFIRSLPRFAVRSHEVPSEFFTAAMRYAGSFVAADGRPHDD